jgi:hypothetical protein
MDVINITAVISRDKDITVLDIIFFLLVVVFFIMKKIAQNYLIDEYNLSQKPEIQSKVLMIL